jgi:hypothetical protein
MSRTKNINFDELDYDEYEEMFPSDKEFQSWMSAIERDYADEMAKIELSEKSNVIIDGSMFDDLDDDVL